MRLTVARRCSRPAVTDFESGRNSSSAPRRATVDAMTSAAMGPMSETIIMVVATMTLAGVGGLMAGG